MFNHPRKSRELKILQKLQGRMELTSEQKKTVKRLESGYEGEVKFSNFLHAGVREKCIPLFDTRLSVKGSEFQNDSILLFPQQIYHLEVKNYKKNYYMDGDRWFYLNGQEINNPLHQLHRNRLLLQDFFQNNQIHLPIKSLIIFPHEEFYLYEAPLDIPAVFFSQMERFINTLNQTKSTITPNIQQISQQIKSNHIAQSNKENMPKYQYEQLKKGVFCNSCRAAMIYDGVHTFYCTGCKRKNNVTDSVLEAVKEFSILFPDELLTVTKIEGWCGEMIKKRRIQRILSDHLTLVHKGRGSYYEWD